MKKLALFVFILLALQVQAQNQNENNPENQEPQQESFTIKPSDMKSSEQKEQLEEQNKKTDAELAEKEDKVVPAATEDEAEEEEVVKPEKVKKEKTYSDDGIRTLSTGTPHNGGFGAIGLKTTKFNDKSTILVGLRGGWIINRAVAIGLEGWGVIPTAEYTDIDLTILEPLRAVGGYGGLFIEPILFSNTVVHVTFPIAGGAGWMGYVKDWEEDSQDYEESVVDGDVYWYVEPGVALEVNVSKHFRIDAGVTKRFTQDFNLINTPNDAFDEFNYFLTLKVGRF